MKTIIASLLLVIWLANPAGAQSKKTPHITTGNCPAATCTDHSYDQAYTAPQSQTYIRPQIAVKNCPAASCTDHSYDEAYSASHSVPAAVNGTTDVMPALPNNTWVSMNGNERVYSIQEFVYYGPGVTGINRPTAYEGDNAPTYDGFQKNVYRNMRYNNDSEPLPSNDGK